jgi:protein TonB
MACAGAGLVALLLLAGPARAAEARYWTAKDLDVRPQVRTHVMPKYPEALPAGVKGVVVVDVFVSASGAVDRVSVVRAKPVNRFEQSAVDAFSAARFSPGMRNGKPAPSRLRIEVTYGD